MILGPRSNISKAAPLEFQEEDFLDRAENRLHTSEDYFSHSNISMGSGIDHINDALNISLPTVLPNGASQSTLNVLDRLSHFIQIGDEFAKVCFLSNIDNFCESACSLGAQVRPASLGCAIHHSKVRQIFTRYYR